MRNKTKILVIDDEPQIRKLLKLSLEANDYDIILAENANLGIQLAASHQPDVILLDLNLPDMDGQTALKQIREWSSAQIIILSVRSSEQDKIRLLDAGADDYITKPFHTGELLARLRVALRHKEPMLENPIIIIEHIEINLASRTVKKSGHLINLTSTEYTILKLLVQNKDKVLTHKQILESIWGNSFSEETQYLRVFIGQLRKKIEDDYSKPKYIKTISGVGYIFSLD
ncbi:MAG: response regulator transcription factor [Candidatus Kapabacteria bacterium]|nr:response regulator transcription factor [Candidatus Kapabacteria bacterium]